MKKSRIFDIITAAIYVLGVIFAISLIIITSAELEAIKNSTSENIGEGIGAAVGAAVLVIMIILLFAFTLISAVPLVMKLICVIKKGGRKLSVACMVFDVIIFAIISLVLISVITDNFSFTPQFAALLISWLAYAAAFVLNLLSAKSYKAIDISSYENAVKGTQNDT